MAGPGTRGFGFGNGWYPSPVGLYGVFTDGKKTGLKEGWKL